MKKYLNLLQINLFQQMFRFYIIGVAAALTHLSLVFLIVEIIHIHPLIANLIAFMIAYNISYWGHRMWTFRERQIQHRTALPKFFCVQLASLILNESLYAVMLKWLHFNYMFSLVLVIGFVALFTFFLSRTWAFQP